MVVGAKKFKIVAEVAGEPVEEVYETSFAEHAIYLFKQKYGEVNIRNLNVKYWFRDCCWIA